MESRKLNLSKDQTYMYLERFIPELKKMKVRVRSLVSDKDSLLMKMKLGPFIVVEIKVIPEGEWSLVKVKFEFSQYKSFFIFTGMVMFLMTLLLSIYLRETKIMFFYLFILSAIFSSYRPKEVVKEFMNHLDHFFIRMKIAPAVVEEEGITGRVEKPSPADADVLYQRLIHTYRMIYGRNAKKMVDRKIQSYMKTGLSREEAIRRLAEEEGLT